MVDEKAGFAEYYRIYYSGKRNYCCNLTKISCIWLEGAFFILSVLTFLLAVIWLYCWSVLNNLSLDIQEFLFQELTLWIPLFVIVLVLSVLICVYLVTVVVGGFVEISSDKPLYMSVCHKIAIAFCLTFCIACFVILNLVWPGNAHSYTIIVSLEMSSPFLQLFSLIIWVFFSLYVSSLFYNIEKVALKYTILVGYAIVLFFFLTIPFWLHSPCIGKIEDELSKPKLFGHRGAPTLAPENTLLSFEKAVENGVYGVEFDVRISWDGIPFIMHDDTLLRTTNVANVFPSRKKYRPELFNWSELKQLNAGDWYLNIDPFQTVAFLKESERSQISSQKILSLEEAARFATSRNISFIFDLFAPPIGHRNRSNFLSGIIHALLDSGIPQERVIWPLSYVEDWDYIKSLAPGFRLFTYDIVNNPSAYAINIYNLPYATTTESTNSLNVSIIQYVINTRLTFSRAWCQGAWAVTTDYCPMLSEMTEPSWVMTTSEYFGVWLAVEVLSLVAIGFIFYYTCKKSQGEQIIRLSQAFNEENHERSKIYTSNPSLRYPITQRLH